MLSAPTRNSGQPIALRFPAGIRSESKSASPAPPKPLVAAINPISGIGNVARFIAHTTRPRFR